MPKLSAFRNGAFPNEARNPQARPYYRVAPNFFDLAAFGRARPSLRSKVQHLRLLFTKRLWQTGRVAENNPQQRTLFANDSQLRCSASGVYKEVPMATALQPLPRSVRAKAEPDKISEYSPLASVWFGEDRELLERMLDFYPRRKPRKILDATVNGGRFWKNSKRPVLGLDIDPRHRPMVVADNTKMPFRDGYSMSWCMTRHISRIKAKTTRKTSAHGSGWCSARQRKTITPFRTRSRRLRKRPIGS